jgi:hypothetical protein
MSPLVPQNALARSVNKLLPTTELLPALRAGSLPHVDSVKRRTIPEARIPNLGSSISRRLVTSLMRQPVTKLREAIRGRDIAADALAQWDWAESLLPSAPHRSCAFTHERTVGHDI